MSPLGYFGPAVWPAIADINIYERKSLSIYKLGLSVCLFVSDKRQNG